MYHRMGDSASWIQVPTSSDTQTNPPPFDASDTRISRGVKAVLSFTSLCCEGSDGDSSDPGSPLLQALWSVLADWPRERDLQSRG